MCSNCFKRVRCSSILYCFSLGQNFLLLYLWDNFVHVLRFHVVKYLKIIPLYSGLDVYQLYVTDKDDNSYIDEYLYIINICNLIDLNIFTRQRGESICIGIVNIKRYIHISLPTLVLLCSKSFFYTSDDSRWWWLEWLLNPEYLHMSIRL